MDRSSNSMARVSFAALAAVAMVAPALSQVKAAFPGPHHPGDRTPLERSQPAQPAPLPTPPPQFPVTGIVGGNGLCAPGWGGNGLGGNTGVVTGGSGLTVSGSFTDNNLNVDFRLGELVPRNRSRAFCPDGVVWTWPLGYYPGGYGYSAYSNGYYDNSSQRYSVVDGALVQQAYAAPAPAPMAAPVPAQPALPPTDAELGAALLRSGDAAGAVDKFRLHLRDHANDADAMRALATALIAKGQADQGVAMMSMAYRTDPALPGHALPANDLFASRADLHRALLKAVAFANKLKAGSSWLSVAVLMQAERRDDNALRMIDRAADQGLDAALAKRFRTALGG